jgi:hypothetical protein
MGGMVDVGEVAARDVEALAKHLGEFMNPSYSPTSDQRVGQRDCRPAARWMRRGAPRGPPAGCARANQKADGE